MLVSPPSSTVGSRTDSTSRKGRPCVRTQARKTVTPDNNFTGRPWFGSGYLNENVAEEKGNYLTRLQNKKVLSSVEKSGLLSALDRAGLSLDRIEKLGLFSTAERLGLLSTVERLLNTEPAFVSSLSIPFFIGTVGSLALLPESNPLLTAGKYTLVALLGGVTLTFFAGGFVLAGLAEDD